MKHVDNPDPSKWLGSNPTLVQQLEKNKHLERSLQYLVEAGHHSIEDLLTLLEEVSSKLKEEMLTTRQQIERQAIRQGRKEGVQEIAKNMLLSLQLGIDVIQQATGLSKEELEQLKNN